MKRLILAVVVAALASCSDCAGYPSPIACMRACDPNPVDYVTTDRCQCAIAKDGGR